MTIAATPPSIYQFRIVLRGISPLIWRRVLVHSNITLAHLHTILQILFAWSDEHLYGFHIHGRAYGSSGASTRGVRLHDLRLHRGERFRYVYDFGAYWECDIRLEALLPRTARHRHPRCTGGKRAAPPEDCRGAWCYLERLDQHRLYPPLEAMLIVAEAINTLLEAEPQTSVREALGDLDEFREAVDCLEVYQQFQPDHFDRREINTQLHALVWTAGGTMKVKVQVVTITDDGQETTREIACVERQDLTPETFGLSLAEGKAVLQAQQGVPFRVAWRKLQEMEDGLGVPLTQRITGGPHGGGTRSTAAGRAYITQFHESIAGLKDLAERQFRAVFGAD